MSKQTPSREEIYDEMTSYIKGDKPTPTQEWTAQTVWELMGKDYGADGWERERAVADAHNASLETAKRDCAKQLAAEREKSRVLGGLVDGYRLEIKKHQAEYDRLSAIIENDTLKIVELEEEQSFRELATALAEREKQKGAATASETTPQEWMPSGVELMIMANPGKAHYAIAAAHNAALAAEREQNEIYRHALLSADDENQQLRKQLDLAQAEVAQIELDAFRTAMPTAPSAKVEEP